MSGAASEPGLSNRPHRGHFEQIPVIVVQNETSMASFDRQCR